MTETEPRPSSRALVASFLFTDLVGFSIGTAAEQYAAKATLSAILRSNLAALRDVDYRIKDTGDGALIAFTSNPEHALYMALAIAEDFGRAASTAGFPSNSLRTGLHLGSVKEAIDLEARPNFIGDGINAAKRIIDFAAPGQITASRAFFDAVASLDSAYAALFRHVGAADDKHGRAHELYAVSPSATVLQELKLDLAAAARESAESAAKSAAMTEVKHESQRVATTASQANSSHADAARKWLLPAGAVIALGVASVLVATKLLGPGTPSIPKLTTESVLVPSASKQAAAPPTSAEETRVDSPPSPALPPKPEVTTPAPAARVEEGAATSDSTRPPSVPAAAAAKTNAKIKPRIDAAPTVPITSNAVPDRTSPRCSRIMEKATLGEALSTEEKRELATSCR
ncbi:MAG: adenylate/guanylate cyclase domain-containing protein [Betaproteobacteria bacterium]|nr:MAG: adenylate/guanylate cyclase domain-containing protein [Betaproteobacteria bacterium]